jgi:hypothetical protein
MLNGLQHVGEICLRVDPIGWVRARALRRTCGERGPRRPRAHHDFRLTHRAESVRCGWAKTHKRSGLQYGRSTRIRACLCAACASAFRLPSRHGARGSHGAKLCATALAARPCEKLLKSEDRGAVGQHRARRADARVHASTAENSGAVRRPAERPAPAACAVDALLLRNKSDADTATCERPVDYLENESA